MASQGGTDSKALIFIAIAIGGAFIILYMLYFVISDYETKIRTAKIQEDQVTVMVASRDLYPGVAITEDDFFAMELPEDYLPVTFTEEGAVEYAEVFYTADRLVGRIPRERILANEVIRNERLFNASSGVGLNAVIPVGMRASSVNIRAAQALSGFLQPGNYVDVLVTLSDDGNSIAHTETLLQAVFVLGVNSMMSGEETNDTKHRGRQKPSVTFLVSAQQAEQLSLAEQIGEIHLSLRNDQDVNYKQLTGADLDMLLPKLKPAMGPLRRAPPPAPSYDTVLMIRGRGASEEVMDQ